MAAEGNWPLIGRLKRAVKKITILLNLNVNRWKLASMIGRTSSKRRLSFNERPGLMEFTEESDENNSDRHSSSSRELQRTTSYPSEEDVDKRADMFIANFYKQLQLERQISLELKYYRGNSFGSASASPSP